MQATQNIVYGFGYLKPKAVTKALIGVAYSYIRVQPMNFFQNQLQ